LLAGFFEAEAAVLDFVVLVFAVPDFAAAAGADAVVVVVGF
jgi:hypothetical protein